MKKFLQAMSLIMVIALVSLAFTGCAKDDSDNSLKKVLDSGKLVVATSPDFPPMEFIDPSKSGDAQYVGFDLDLARHIASELGVTLVIESMDFSACQAAVSQKSVDLSISGYSVTQERLENYNLSDFYYAGDNETNQCILILKSRAEELSTKESFAGLDVAAQNASLQMNLLTSQLPDAVAVPIVELNTAVLELINGKVDALCVAKGNGEAFIANYPELTFSDWEFTIDDDGYSVMLPKGADALTARVNEILSEVHASGLNVKWYESALSLSKSLGLDIEE